MPSVKLRRTGRTREEQRKVTVIAVVGSCGLFLFSEELNGRVTTWKDEDYEI